MSQKVIYSLWIIAFALKEIGASWDASFHFKHLRDFSQLPHIVNGAGLLLACILSAYLWRKKEPTDRNHLKITISGILVFFAGIPMDEMWHRAFGIDLTTWSPTHFILYTGTAMMIFGVILQSYGDNVKKHISALTKNVVQTILLAGLLGVVWFPLLQQEQGVIAYHLLQIGEPIADEEILSLLNNPAKDLKTQIFGGAPDWLYAIYTSFMLAFFLRLVKKFNIITFTGTIIAGIYLLLRSIMDSIFAISSYPTSSIPYFILLGAFIFDLIHIKERKFLTSLLASSVAVVASMYSAPLLRITSEIYPAIPQQVIGWSFFSAIIGYAIAEKLIIMGQKYKNTDIWALIPKISLCSTK